MRDTYCPLPFRHVFLEPRGIRPCCSYDEVFNTTIDQWVGSKRLRRLQENVLSGQVDPGCATCLSKEQANGTSTRLNALRDYAGSRDTLTKIDYVDYRSSNICNFKCRSCEPFYSNGISQEIKKDSRLVKFYSAPDSKVASINEQDKDWILSNLHSIKRLMFTGGEPTKIPEVRELIDFIIKQSLDIQIMITSNASFTDGHWFDITKKHKNLHWTLSLDAVGPAAEIIRHGTDWNLVKHNIETMYSLAHSVSIGTVVTNLSIFGLGDLFDYVNGLYPVAQNNRSGGDHLLEICQYPAHLNPCNLPNDLRDQALRGLNITVEQRSQADIVGNLIANLSMRTFDPVLWQKFQEHNSVLDDIRGQNHRSLFPAQ